MHIFLCQNVPVFPFFILLTLKKLTPCSLRVSTHFGVEVAEQFGIDKQKISNIHKDFLNYTNFFI